MDKRTLNIGLEDEIELAGVRKTVAVCQHVRYGDISGCIHLDFDDLQELLVAQCAECASKLYEDCDLLISENYTLVDEEKANRLITFCKTLLTADDLEVEDVVFICKHDGNILRNSFERMKQDGSG